MPEEELEVLDILLSDAVGVYAGRVSSEARGVLVSRSCFLSEEMDMAEDIVCLIEYGIAE